MSGCWFLDKLTCQSYGLKLLERAKGTERFLESSSKQRKFRDSNGKVLKA